LNVVGLAEAVVVAAATEELVVKLPVGVVDADEDELVEEIPAHLAYAEFAALETTIWNSPIPLSC
jgi:hypothetical protein